MNDQHPSQQRRRVIAASSLTVKLLVSLLLLFFFGSRWSQSASAASPAAEVITNTVSVDSTTTDPNPIDNTANQSTTVNSEADLQISKSNGVGSVVPGTLVTYTIIVTNAGPSAVSNAPVADTLPAAIISATWTCSASGGSNCDANSGTGSINTTVDLLANGTAIYTVTAQTSSTATGNLVNTATITPPPGTTDPNPSNNTSTDTDPLLTGTLTGAVFIDANGNGVQDPGEGYTATVIITTSVGTTIAVTTDSTGLFTVTVPAGDTNVDVNNANLPAGSVQTVGTDPNSVPVPAGGTAQDINGYEQRGLLYGHIYEDKNGDGDQDPGEPNLPNISVVITNAFGVTQTQVTDSSGNYTATVPTGSASNLYSATVDIVNSTLPVGYIQTQGGDPTTVNGLVAGGQKFEENNGFQIRGQVVGVVYMDEDGNGNYNLGVDTPLTVTVRITDSNGVSYTLTTVNGAFTQTVPTGNTQVDVLDNTLPAGVILTGGSSDPTTVVVPGGGSARDDTGYVILSSIGDRLWLDLDGDSVVDSNEPGLPGVVITLTSSITGPITATTGTNGYYTFGDLNPGQYTVTVDITTLPVGVTQTFDRDNTPDHKTSATIASATVITNADFGYKGNSSIGDLVWNDLNGNGTYENGEPGISGVVITLTFPGGFAITTTTNISGSYVFTGLIPGAYTVDVNDSTLPVGTVLTTGSNVYNVNLPAATNYTTADFGYQQRGQVYGHIFEDINGNGVQDNGEPNLSGIDVVVTNGLGVTQTVTTDGSGNYTATVPTGSSGNPFTATTNVVESTLPAGAVQTVGTDLTTITVYPAINNDAGIDGYQRRGVVEGRVWEDRDNNGVYDAGTDQALANVTVIITDSNGITTAVETNSLGYFSKTVPYGTTSVNVDDNDVPATLKLENGFIDPDTVNVPGNGTATTAFPYVEPLKIDKDSVTKTIIAGTQATYTVVLRNIGAQLLTNVTVSDSLPMSFTYASSTVDATGASRTSTSDPAANATTPVWSAWNINPGGIVTITFVVNVASSANAAVYDNTGVAYSSETGMVDDDGTVGQDNNTPYGQDPENDEDVTVITRADLSVSKTDDRDPVAAGTQVTYTIIVTNAGPSDARDVVITDTLPSGVTFVSATSGCSLNAGKVVCSFGTVEVNTTRTVTVVVQVSQSLVASSGNGGPAMATQPSGNDSVASAAPLNGETGQPAGSTAQLGNESSTAQVDEIVSAAPGHPAVAASLFKVTQPALDQQYTSAINLARSWTTAKEWLHEIGKSALRKNVLVEGVVTDVKLSPLS